MKEVEIKFPVRDPQLIRKRLSLLGGTAGEQFFEDNLLFDDDSGTLQARGLLLRLRKSDGAFLTFKRPLAGERYKVREEFQVSVSDFSQTEAILTGLGYRVAARYQKERETWHVGGVEAMLDRTPIGYFLELEGTPEQIEDVAGRLKIERDTGITLDYLTLYREHCARHGLEAGDMVF